MFRLTTFALLFVCAPAARPADWPQWLGPTRDGASPEKVAPWKEAPEVVWRKPVAEGNSSPVVAGGRVFLHAKIAGKNEEGVVAFDAATGAEAWRQTYPRAVFLSPYGNGPRATPAVADGRLYTFGITGALTAWDAASGKRLWQADALRQFNAKNLFFGASCSPLVEGGRVLVNVGGKGASVVAFDAASGAVAWKSQDDAASYSSPVVLGNGPGRQAVFLTQAGVVGLNPSNGDLFWRFPLVDKLLESSTTPAVAGDVLLASAITYGSAGLRLGAKDGRPGAAELWKNPALTSYFSTPAAVGDHFYLVTGTNPLAGAGKTEADLHCVEAKTGKSLWKRPRVGKYHASLLRTGDGKLLMLEDTGSLVLLDPDPAGYREVARSKVCGETWAHPALANGRLYLRDDKEVLCLRLGE